MSAKLSNRQKGYLAQLAKQAYDKASVEGLVLPEVGEWRHQQVSKACGKLGLTCCSQDDYKLVEGHFLELLGRHGAAFNAQLRSATEGRRVAESVLVKECGKAGVRLAYAETVCRNQFKCALYDASTAQIWKLVFTVRNRGNKRKREARGGTPLPLFGEKAVAA